MYKVLARYNPGKATQNKTQPNPRDEPSQTSLLQAKSMSIIHVLHILSLLRGGVNICKTPSVLSKNGINIAFLFHIQQYNYFKLQYTISVK